MENNTQNVTGINTTELNPTAVDPVTLQPINAPAAPSLGMKIMTGVTGVCGIVSTVFMCIQAWDYFSAKRAQRRYVKQMKKAAEEEAKKKEAGQTETPEDVDKKYPID